MNNKITGRQLQYVIALFIIGSSLVSGTSVKAGQDSWITIILGTILAILVIFIYNSILRLYPGENLFDIIINIFGKIIGKIICLIFIFYFIHLGSLVLNVYSEFINIVNMPETPKIVIACLTILPCFLLVYNGASSVGRVSSFLFPLLAFSVILTIVAGVKSMNFDNIKPILTSDIKTLMDSSFTVFALPLAEIVIFTSFFSFIDLKENYLKIFLNGLLLGVGILLIANLRNIFLLSPVSTKIFPFASYQAVSIIAIGDFFTRVEVIIGANLLLAGLVKISVSCYSSCIGLAKVLNIKEYKYFAVPVLLILLTLTGFSFKNTIEMFKFVEIYKIYAIPFQIILPIIILVVGKVKINIQKSQDNSNKSTATENG